MPIDRLFLYLYQQPLLLHERARPLPLHTYHYF